MKCAPYWLCTALSVSPIWMSMVRFAVVTALLALFVRFVSFGVETETLSVIVVPLGVVAPTFTTKLNEPLVPPDRMLVFEVQVNVPVPPTAGTPAQVKFAGGVNETKVVFAGTVSVSVMVW